MFDIILFYESAENVEFGLNRNLGSRCWVSAAQLVKRSSRINTFDVNRNQWLLFLQKFQVKVLLVQLRKYCSFWVFDHYDLKISSLYFFNGRKFLTYVLRKRLEINFKLQNEYHDFIITSSFPVWNWLEVIFNGWSDSRIFHLSTSNKIFFDIFNRFPKTIVRNSLQLKKMVVKFSKFSNYQKKP